MSEPENFLTRWSRRKLEAEPSIDANTPSVGPRESGNPESPIPAEKVALDPHLRGGDRGGSTDVNQSTKPAFDLTKLPSIESIDAATDIRAFLQAGVPPDLTRAALRRAWSSDPTIRDFIGIAENQWDFTAPDGVPGFGPMQAIDDVRRMVADIMGDLDKLAAPEQQQPTANTSDSDPHVNVALQDEGAISQDQVEQKSIESASDQQPGPDPQVDVAMQHEERQAEYRPLPPRRPHGGALPE